MIYISVIKIRVVIVTSTGTSTMRASTSPRSASFAGASQTASSNRIRHTVKLCETLRVDVSLLIAEVTLLCTIRTLARKVPWFLTFVTSDRRSIRVSVAVVKGGSSTEVSNSTSKSWIRSPSIISAAHLSGIVIIHMITSCPSIFIL
jgi:hypothetical protein